MTLDHRHLREMLGAYALGHLGDDDATTVRAHLDGCPACRADLATIAPAAAALRHVDPDALASAPAPTPGLGDAVLARIRDARAPSRSARRRRLRPRARPPVTPIEPVALRADAGIDAEADVIPHTWGMEIRMTATGVAPDTAYQVVVLDDEGRRVGAGAFVGTGPDPLTYHLNSSVLRDDATGFEVLGPDGDPVLTSIIRAEDPTPRPLVAPAHERRRGPSTTPYLTRLRDDERAVRPGHTPRVA